MLTELETAEIARDYIPWKGRIVVIVKKHAMKGYHAVIKDVLCDEASQSGIKLVIQFLQYSAAAPYQSLTFDYDDVVDAL